MGVIGSSRRKRTKRPSSDSSSAMAPSPPSRKAAASDTRRWGRAACASSFLVALVLYFIWMKATSRTSPPRFFTIEVVNEFPHDPDAFTQGLVYGGSNTLYESTGLYGRSSVRLVLLHSGEVQALHRMDRSFFGEGLTLLDERLFQVTWLKNVGFIYDRYNFSNNKKYTHEMQDGWGLTTDGQIIYGTDGSSTLYQLDPHTGKALRKTTVRYEDSEVPYLNELEYINGEVWANVWSTDCIARISPQNGMVLSWILLHELRQSLLSSGYNTIDVLNGIAWDEKEKRLFVTGKLWPKLYEIKLHTLMRPVNGVEKLCIKS